MARSERLARLASVTTAGCLVLAGCVSGGHTAKQPPSSAPRSSSAPGSTNAPPAPALQTQIYRDSEATIRFELLSLARLNSKVLKLRIRVTPLNAASHLSDDFSSGQSDKSGESGQMFSGLALTDASNMKAYFPLAKQQGGELQVSSPDISNSLTERPTQGEAITWTVFYPSPPPGVSKVDIVYPAGPPFTGVSITGGARVENGEPDPTKIPLKSPHVEDLLSRVDDLNGDESVDDSGNGRDIRLNTDVLFALNKASLSAKASGILKNVAQQIDKASSTVIKVDGYTDNSGNDAINNPLSRRRAEAVANKLKDLVTRSGVSFKTAGHGSADPVATNDSADGRKKNRRVTVTIGK